MDRDTLLQQATMTLVTPEAFGPGTYFVGANGIGRVLHWGDAAAGLGQTMLVVGWKGFDVQKALSTEPDNVGPDNPSPIGVTPDKMLPKLDLTATAPAPAAPVLAPPPTTPTGLALPPAPPPPVPSTPIPVEAPTQPTPTGGTFIGNLGDLLLHGAHPELRAVWSKVSNADELTDLEPEMLLLAGFQSMCKRGLWPNPVLFRQLLVGCDVLPRGRVERLDLGDQLGRALE